MIYLEVKLPDTPGSLIELIKPISENGGNIFGILHYHDKKINNMIPVSITFELNEQIKEISLKNIKSRLSEKNIKIEKITFGSKQRHLIVILTGHVFDTDVVDTMQRLALKNIRVPELQAKFTDLSDVSNVKLKLDYPETMTEAELLQELESICKEKNIFLIRT